MGAPTTPILDAFNRANENPLSGGGNWAARSLETGSAPQLLNNAVTGTSTAALSGADWVAGLIGPDCEVYYTLTTIPAAGNYVRLYLRVTNRNVGAETGYMMQWVNSAAGVNIYKETANGAYTSLAANAAATYTNGDQICFQAVGNTLTVYKNSVSTLTVTDATYTTAGYVGIGLRDTTTVIDNFGGGAPGAGLDQLNSGSLNHLSYYYGS